jgi:hypothetical protein
MSLQSNLISIKPLFAPRLPARFSVFPRVPCVSGRGKRFSQRALRLSARKRVFPALSASPGENYERPLDSVSGRRKKVFVSGLLARLESRISNCKGLPRAPCVSGRELRFPRCSRQPAQERLRALRSRDLRMRPGREKGTTCSTACAGRLRALRSRDLSRRISNCAVYPALAAPPWREKGITARQPAQAAS